MSNWGRQSAGAALAAIYAYLFAKMGVLSVNLVRREDRMKWNYFQAEKLLRDTAQRGAIIFAAPSMRWRGAWLR
jgi:hypothetical protein